MKKSISETDTKIIEMVRNISYHLDEKRVIALIDIDCFSVQVDLKNYPEYVGHPCATKQEGINSRIVSVNYEAKARGVTREMKANEAQNKCPEIQFFNIPQKYEKPYLRKYTEASDQIFDCIMAFVEKFGNSITIERASQDEVYLDMTDICKQHIEADNTYTSQLLRNCDVIVEGGKRPFLLSNRNGMRRSPLTHGAVLITNLCDEILCKTGYKSSAGISYNKLLAKIACDFNKPNRVTIIATKPGIKRVFKKVKVENIHGLGGKLGIIVKKTLSISGVNELRGFRKRKLIKEFDIKIGKFLWEASRGIDDRPVIFKTMSKFVNSGRKFFKGINNSDQKEWYTMLECQSLCEKLIYDKKRNKRIAQYIRAEFCLKKKLFVRIKFDLNSQFYDDCKYIYSQIESKAFPDINQCNERRIFEINLTASNFKPEEERSQISSVELTANRLETVQINLIMVIQNSQNENSYNNFDNFYTNDENDDYENWCQEYYDSYHY